MREAVFVPVAGAYVVSFKRRRSGRLRNVIVRGAASVVEASRRALARMIELGFPQYREYGVSQYKEMQCPVEFWITRGRGVEWRLGGSEHWRKVIRREA